MHIHYKKPTLFLVVLGGRTKGSHIELHDIRWVIGKSIEETYKELRSQWLGEQKGLHIDSYIAINHIDGYIVVPLETKTNKNQEEHNNKLWFVNLGGYNPNKLSEEHEFGLFVADSKQQAKSIAKTRLLKNSIQRHKDDLLEINNMQCTDNIYSINKINNWNIHLCKDPLERNQPMKPDWFGYLKIDQHKLSQ